ncbi:MAG: rhodanese-like domain-containing protein [Ignavibacteria bacterium]|nr:rhodanese-like domain-containing protein [Ignavibacteria bacterium]
MKKTFHELCEESNKNVKECSVQDVKNMIEKNITINGNEDFILIDVREDNEFIAGNIEGSVHIGKGIIERDIHLYVGDHDKKIVLYCGGGYRSVLAAESLQKMGYSDVISMKGGWKEWNLVKS